MDIEPFEVNSKNIKDCIGLDIVAFKWATGGACGEPGGVVFITSDAKLYHANYVYGDSGINSNDIFDIFPPLNDMHPGIFGGGQYPPEWKDIYLGLGNYLGVRDTIWERFIQIAQFELSQLHEEGDNSILYNIWASVVVKALQNEA